jgi:segregation and condensation protein B
MLYGTTTKFMEYFGISDLMELPTPKEFTGEVNTIGNTTGETAEAAAETETQESQETSTTTPNTEPEPDGQA